MRTGATRRTDLEEKFGERGAVAQEAYDHLFFNKRKTQQSMPNMSGYKRLGKTFHKSLGDATLRKRLFLEGVKEKYGDGKEPPENEPGKEPGEKKPGTDFKEQIAEYLDGVRQDYTRNWITPRTGVSKGRAPTPILDALRGDDDTYFKLHSDEAQTARDALYRGLGTHYVVMPSKGNDSYLDKMLGSIGIERKAGEQEGFAKYSVRSRAEDAQITAENVEEFLSASDRRNLQRVNSERKAERFINRVSKQLSDEYNADWLSISSRLGSGDKHVSVYDAAKSDEGFAKEAVSGNYEGAITNYLMKATGGQEKNHYVLSETPGLNLSSRYKKQSRDVELNVPVGRVGYQTHTKKKRFTEYRLVK